jgi:putative membrane protein
MVMRPSQLLDPADRQRIEAAVIEAERATAGEIVVAVVHASDEYGSAGWRLGMLLAVLAFLGLTLFAPDLPLLAYLGAQGVALLAGHGLARLDPVRRLLVSEALAEASVRRRAVRAFAEAGLRRTARHTGILLLASLLERRLVVLADEGIDRVLDPDESWQEVVDLAVQGLRARRPAQGLVDAVGHCGEILARHLPLEPPRNLDELPNPPLLLED